MLAQGSGGPVSEPSAVMSAKANMWSGFWSSPVFPGQLEGVIGSTREVYLSSGSTPDPIDPVAFRATAHAYGTRKSTVRGLITGVLGSLLRFLSGLSVISLACLTNVLPEVFGLISFTLTSCLS